MKKNIIVFVAILLMNNVTAQVKVAVIAAYNYAGAKAIYAGIRSR